MRIIDAYKIKYKCAVEQEKNLRAHEEFEAKYLANPSNESIEKYERAFGARMAYEKTA